MMDEVTRAALDIAVEQLEEAEAIIKALTEENERLKALVQVDNPWSTTTTYPRQTITWTGIGSAATTTPNQAAATFVSLHTASTAASGAIADMAARTEQFNEKLQKVRKLIEDGKVHDE